MSETKVLSSKRSAFKQLGKNALSLSLLQAVNYLLPFALLPYIVSVVGIENFGLTNYMLAAMMPMKIIADYGYNLSGIKDIVEKRGNAKAVAVLVSRIFSTKVYLLLMLLFALVVIVAAFPVTTPRNVLIASTFTVVLGQAMMPLWYFQGTERTGVVLGLSLLTRLVYVGLLLILVRQPSDYVYVNLALGVADILLSAGCFLYILRNEKIRVNLISVKAFREELSRNFPLVKLNVLTTLNLLSPLLLLGAFSSNFILGVYGIADRILQVIRASATILYGAVFPRTISIYNNSKEELALFFRRFQLLVAGLYAPIVVACLFFPVNIIHLVSAGHVHPETVLSLKILSVIPLLAGLSIIPSQMLLVQNRNKYYSNIVLLGSVMGIGVAVFFIAVWGYVGAAISAVAIELLMLAFLVLGNRQSIFRLFQVVPGKPYLL